MIQSNTSIDVERRSQQTSREAEAFCITVPAVDHNWSCIRNAFLLMVHLLEKVQYTTRITWDSMIRPSSEMILPDCSLCVPLEGRYQHVKKNPSDQNSTKSITSAKLSQIRRQRTQPFYSVSMALQLS